MNCIMYANASMQIQATSKPTDFVLTKPIFIISTGYETQSQVLTNKAVSQSEAAFYQQQQRYSFPDTSRRKDQWYP